MTKYLFCDVNEDIGRKKDGFGNIVTERPLAVSLQNIQSKNDKSFQISRLLLEHEDINVNAKCGLMDHYTVLGLLCDTQCESTLGVRMLLEDRRTDVN